MKRLTAVFLVLCMTLSLLITASAEEAGAEVSVPPLTQGAGKLQAGPEIPEEDAATPSENSETLQEDLGASVENPAALQEDPAAPVENTETSTGDTEPPVEKPLDEDAGTLPVLEAFDNPQTLTSNAPITVTLTGSEPLEFIMTGNSPGFYRLSCTHSDSADSDCELWVQGTDGNYSPHREDDPLYLGDQGRNGRVELNWPQSGNVECTISLEPFEMDELTAGYERTFTEPTYFQCTPASGTQYQLTFQVTGGGNVDGLRQWNANTKEWEYKGPVSNGTTYLLTPESDGNPCYLWVYPYGGASVTVTVSEYTPVEEPTVWSGTPQNQNRFSVAIPVMFKLPPTYSQGNIETGIEYKVGDATSTDTLFIPNPGEMGTVQTVLELLPGLKYQYRAFLNVLGDDNRVEKQVTEGWKDGTAPQAAAVSLNLGDTTITPEGDDGGYVFLSFTPQEEGRYTFIAAEDDEGQYWDPAQARWVWFARSGAVHDMTRTMSTGETLYLRIGLDYNLSSSSFHVEKFVAKVDHFSIAAEAPTEMERFMARIPVLAQVPYGSSFRIGLELSAGGHTSERFYRDVDNLERESWSEAVYAEVLPGQTYTCTPFIEAFDPETGESVIGSRVTGESITFNTPAFTVVPLTVGVQAQVGQRECQYLSFTPAESGTFLISVEGTAPGWLYYWDYDNGEWARDKNSSFNGTTQMLISAQANVPQYIQLYPKNGEETTFEVTVQKYVSTVTGFNLEAGAAKTDVPGFQAKIPVRVELPLDKNCRLDVQVLSSNGRWRSTGGPMVRGIEGERQTIDCVFETVPNKTVTYRVCLIPTDTNGNELSGIAHITSPQQQFTSENYKAENTVVLTLNQEKRGTSLNGDDVFAVLNAPEAGAYQITLTGSRYLYVASADGSDWQYRRAEDGKPVSVRLEAGPQYFRISGNWNSAEYTIKVTRLESSVTGFTVTSGTATTTTGTLGFSVPVTVTAPLGSRYSCDVVFSADGERWTNIDGGNTDFSEEETLHFTVNVPAYPGRTYQYYAVVYDQLEHKVHEEGKGMGSPKTVSVPALPSGTVIPELTEGSASAPATGTSAYTFTPTKTGYYLFSGEGGYGNISILQADGTCVYRYFNEGDELAAANVSLTAGQAVYVVLEVESRSPASVRVCYTPLAADWESYANSQLKVTLTPEAGTVYVLAAYDGAGRLLDDHVVTGNTGRAVEAVLKAGNDARYVKAFQLDSSYKPAAVAEKVPIG